MFAFQDSLKYTCNVYYFFFLMHQVYFIYVPILMLKYEDNLGTPAPGTRTIFRLYDKVMKTWTSSPTIEPSELA